MNPVNYEKYKEDKKQKSKWQELKNFLYWYEQEHGFPRDDGKPGRYCLALSVDDILTIMQKIEQDCKK